MLFAKDHYAVLGVQRGASGEEIKLAYRRLVRRFHPDVSTEPDAEARFKEVVRAYDALTNGYDSIPGFGNGASSQPGEGVFAHQARRTRREAAEAHAAQGEDYGITATISLEHIVSGAKLRVGYDVTEQARDGSLRDVRREVELRIPKGARHGDELTVKGKGGPGVRGGPPGDLYVTIAVAKHRLFKVLGDDLELELPISPSEAVLGAKITVPTLEKPVPVKIPAGAQAGDRLTVPARGLPSAEGKRGDLYLLLRVVMPRAVSAAERELYERLGRLSRFNPRLDLED